MGFNRWDPLYQLLVRVLTPVVTGPTSDLSTVDLKAFEAAEAAFTTDGGKPLAAFMAYRAYRQLVFISTWPCMAVNKWCVDVR